MLRFRVFVVTAVIAISTFLVFAAAGYLSLDPPLIDPLVAEKVRTWGLVIFALSAVPAAITAKREWIEDFWWGVPQRPR